MTDRDRTALPLRHEVPEADTWDLSRLFPDDAAWEAALQDFEQRMTDVDAFQGTLQQGADQIRQVLDWMMDLGQLDEKLAYYAHLRVSEDIGDSTAQARWSRYLSVSTAYQARASFLTPELQAIPDTDMNAWLDTDALAPYRIYLHKVLRHKPHVLSAAEERLLAMQTEFSQVANQGFSALTDVDMDFGYLETDAGPQPLTHASYAAFIQNPDRSVRQQAYEQYLAEFHAHRHTLAALYNGSVQRDVYHARVRRFPSAIEARLFNNDVPIAVYDQLIEQVRAHLPDLHRYYDLRRRALKLDALRLYDTRVPLVPEVKTQYTYDEAVTCVTESLALLGEEYVEALETGLRGRWVDRYENKGKRSGAFSAASYHGDPYILMNYKPDVLQDLFTLTHEAGHSMHSWYSVRSQPFQDYAYTIFVAEVASTFNEQCLADYLMARTDDPKLRTYLINKQVDDVLATLFRQTMFAEFERETHAMVERNEPLTVESLTGQYERLLTDYFGPEVPLEPHSPLECLRIPHFYSAFYVYQYATGLAASLALYEQVRQGDTSNRERYLRFLSAGGNAFPLDQLRDAGVDLRGPEPMQQALTRFRHLVDQLAELCDGNDHSS